MGSRVNFFLSSCVGPAAGQFGRKRRVGACNEEFFAIEISLQHNRNEGTIASLGRYISGGTLFL